MTRRSFFAALAGTGAGVGVVNAWQAQPKPTVQVPHTFAYGTTLTAETLNENFAYLARQVDEALQQLRQDAITRSFYRRLG